SRCGWRSERSRLRHDHMRRPQRAFIARAPAPSLLRDRSRQRCYRTFPAIRALRTRRIRLPARQGDAGDVSNILAAFIHKSAIKGHPACLSGSFYSRIYFRLRQNWQLSMLKYRPGEWPTGRIADALALAIMVAVAIIAALTFRDYGLGWDDYTHA